MVGQQQPRRGVAVVVAVAGLLCAVYVLTHPYPTHRGGLYLLWARAIAANGFVPPAFLSGYTVEPLSFAYPPLGLTVLAVPLALGVPDLLVLRLLPPLTFVGAALAVFWFVHDRFADARAATLAAVFTLATPQVLYQSVVGAGVTRSLGLLFAVVGLVFVRRAMAAPRGEWRALGLAGACFGLCLLTHYIYTLLFVVGTLLTVALEHRHLPGVGRGAVVAAVGALVASPWYLLVAVRHGPGIVLAPGGSYQGGLAPVPGLLAYKLLVQRVSPVGYLVVCGALLGGWTLYRRGRPFLPTLAAAYGLVYPHDPSLYALFAALAGVGVAERLGVDARQSMRSVPAVRGLKRVGLAAVLCSSLALGGAYLHADSDAVGSPPTPLDADAADAMRWVDAETPADATFLAGGRLGEWFPALAHRPIVASQWGTEWVADDRREVHWFVYWWAFGCGGPDCYADLLDRTDVAPDYLVTRANATERRAFRATDRFTVVHRSGAVLVVRVDDRATRRSAATSPSTDLAARHGPVRRPPPVCATNR